jgi:hypothetical protein
MGTLRPRGHDTRTRKRSSTSAATRLRIVCIRSCGVARSSSCMYGAVRSHSRNASGDMSGDSNANCVPLVLKDGLKE